MKLLPPPKSFQRPHVAVVVDCDGVLYIFTVARGCLDVSPHARLLGDACSSVMHLLLSPEDQLPPGFPTIDMGPQLKVVERSRTATMLCAASGNPDPEITWFKDFLPVNTSSNNGRIKQLRSGDPSFLPITFQDELFPLAPPTFTAACVSRLRSPLFFHGYWLHLSAVAVI